jgi:hypothetical protein
MPRVKPIYEWPITEGKPLKNEPTNKRTNYKQGGKKFKESSPPKGLPSASTGQSDVSYGSHRHNELLVRSERKRLGL